MSGAAREKKKKGCVKRPSEKKKNKKKDSPRSFSFQRHPLARARPLSTPHAQARPPPPHPTHGTDAPRPFPPMADPPKKHFASRGELLAWINGTLGLALTKIEQV